MIPLGARQLTLRAVCRQKTTIRVRFEGEAADSNSYKLAQKGRFTVKLSNATLDGNSVQLARTTSSSDDTSEASVALELHPHESITAIAQGRRAVGEVFSAQVEIQAYLDEGMTRTRDVTSLEGRGALTLDTQ